MRTLTVTVVQPVHHLVNEDRTQRAPLPLLIQPDDLMLVRHFLCDTATRGHCWGGHRRGKFKCLQKINKKLMQ